MKILGGRSYITTNRLDRNFLLGSVAPVDLIEIDGSTIGIKELREALNLLQMKPFGELRLAIIHQAEMLSLQCQTTLLKSLEEPAADAAIILSVDSPEGLLLTVRSRLYPLGDGRVRDDGEGSSTLTLSNESDARKQLQSITNREEAISFFKRLLTAQKAELIGAGSLLAAKRVELTDNQLRKLNQNVNWKLALEKFLQDWFGSDMKDEG